MQPSQNDRQPDGRKVKKRTHEYIFIQQDVSTGNLIKLDTNGAYHTID